MQSVVHCKLHQHSTLYLSWVSYTVAACFPFEPIEKCTTFKDIFPALSGPGIFKEKIQDYLQEVWDWEPC